MKFEPCATVLINLIIIHKRNLLAQVIRVMAFLSRILKILLDYVICVFQVLWVIFKITALSGQISNGSCVTLVKQQHSFERWLSREEILKNSDAAKLQLKIRENCSIFPYLSSSVVTSFGASLQEYLNTVYIKWYDKHLACSFIFHLLLRIKMVCALSCNFFYVWV